MDLAESLGLGDRELAAFVGAGGKETAMAQLIEEASERGLAAGYTTTTHMPPPDLPLAVGPAERLERGLERHEPPVAFAREWVDQPERADRKLRGFDPAVVDWVYRTRRFDWLLVKADGARRRAFKAPGADEPAVPAETSHLIPVAGVRVIGQPLGDQHVHRVAEVAAITGLDRGDRLDAAAVGAVLGSPAGGLKAVPAEAAVTFLVNQADTPELAGVAREVLHHAFDTADRPVRGVISSFRSGRCQVVLPEAP